MIRDSAVGVCLERPSQALPDVVCSERRLRARALSRVVAPMAEALLAGKPLSLLQGEEPLSRRAAHCGDFLCSDESQEFAAMQRAAEAVCFAVNKA